MKSFNHFISEKKRIGTAAPAPEPGGRDPLDPTGRRRISKRYSDPSNPPKVPNPDPEALKPKPASDKKKFANPEATKPSSPEPIKQADASKRQVRFRRAQRIKGATGGKPTGSLRSGNLSFPGDRSGAYQRAKTDLEARKGFSGSKSGGLKADETSKFVDRTVRQQRTVKQGIPDPFKTKTPAPSNPFKGVVKKIKSTVSSQVPDPFASATTKPKTSPKPKAPSGPGPATSQAIKDIRSSMSRLGIKTTEADVVQRYMRTAQDSGRAIDPDLVGPQGLKASGAKPEMVGHSSSTKAERTRFRAQRDATRDISRARGADLDKAVKNLVDRGTVRKPRTSFRQFSQKAAAFTDAAKKFGDNQPIKPGSSPAPKSLDTSPTKPGAGYVQGNKPQPGSEVVKYQPKPKKNLFQRLREPSFRIPGTSKRTAAPELPNTKPLTPLSKTEVVPPDTKLPQFDSPKAEPKGPKVTSDAGRTGPRTGSRIPTGVRAGASKLLGVASVVGTGVDAAAEFKRVKDSGGNVGDAALASGTRVLGGWAGAKKGAALGASIMAPVPIPGARVAGTIVGAGLGYVAGAGLASSATDLARSKYKGSSGSAPSKPVSYNANSVGQRGAKGGLTDAQLDKLMSVQRAKRKRMQSKT